jgi:hypothetical protein
MLNIEMALIVNLLLLWPTPTLADAASEFARCEIEAQRVIPTPPNKGAQNWAERAANLQKCTEMLKSACGRLVVEPRQLWCPFTK